MRKWIEDPSVKAALHVDKNANWEDADETGPVADNLRTDMVLSVIPQIE